MHSSSHTQNIPAGSAHAEPSGGTVAGQRSELDAHACESTFHVPPLHVAVSRDFGSHPT